MADVEVIKKGENIAMLDLKRSKFGLILSVKTHACIEELFKEWSGDEVQDIIVHGKAWTPLKGQAPLQVYRLPKSPGYVGADRGWVYFLDQPGRELIQQQNGSPALNLSFLRLVGVSGEAGVSFALGGVHTTDAIDELGEVLQAAIRRFYQAYLMPVDISLKVFTSMEHLK